MAAVIVVALWGALDVRRTWQRIDSSARDFQLPGAFTEVSRVRQGTAFCFVTCTNGGDAQVTIVMGAGEMSVEDACSAMGAAVSSAGSDARPVPAGGSQTCSWEGRLGDGATIRGVVAKRSDLKPLGPARVYGPRWTEETATPRFPFWRGSSSTAGSSSSVPSNASAADVVSLPLKSVQVGRKTALVASAVLVPVLIAVSLLLYLFVYQGAPLWDEWYCSRGEAPVDFEDGGSTCASKGSTLPAGGTWDPLGNRPFSCDDRRGWTVIHRDGTDDCLRDGLAMPDGWSEGPVRR